MSFVTLAPRIADQIYGTIQELNADNITKGGVRPFQISPAGPVDNL
jgi:hypothetical protein